LKTLLLTTSVLIGGLLSSLVPGWAYPGLPSYIDMNIGQDRTILPLKSIYEPGLGLPIDVNSNSTGRTDYIIDEGFILNRGLVGRTAINASALFLDIGGKTNYEIERVTIEIPGKWVAELERVNGVQYDLGEIPPGVYLVNVILKDDNDNIAGYQGIISYGIDLTNETRAMTDELITQANDPRAPSGLFVGISDDIGA
jgi:hypothetical protein